MTTTYYIQMNRCEYCGRADRISMGVSAMGWKFLFYTDKEHKNASAWLIEIMDKNATIYDGCGGQVSHEDFAHLIGAKRGAKSTTSHGGDGDRFTTDGDFDYTDHHNSVD